MTSYFDGLGAPVIDLAGTLIYKPTPRFYRAASDFLAKHGSHVTEDMFRSMFRRHYWEHSIGNYETDPEFYSAVRADLFLTYDLLPAPDLRYWTMRRVFVARWRRSFVRATNSWGRA